MGIGQPLHRSIRRLWWVVTAVVLALVYPTAQSNADPVQRPAFTQQTSPASDLIPGSAPGTPVPPERISSLIVKTADARAVTAPIRQRAARLAAAADAGSVTGVTLGGGGASVLTLAAPISADAAVAMSTALASQPGVEWAEPNWPMHAVEASPVAINDPDYSRQWALWDAPSTIQGGYSIHAPEAWQKTTGSSSIVVAVLDTGITDHPDLDTQIVKQAGVDYGYDMVSDPAISNDGDGRDPDAHDPGDYSSAFGCDRHSSWHGTHVAGIIAAAQNNGVGVSGVAPGVRLEPVRVLGACGGATSDVADGIRWAAGGTVTGVPANLHPAKVINLSLGGATTDGCPSEYQTAIDYARSRGTVVVVAAGNSGVAASGFTPANCRGVITTVATGRTGSLAFYSDFGTRTGDVQIAAPGGDDPTYDTNDDEQILSTLNSGSTVPADPIYGYLQGTSMATPQVSGTVALMLSVRSMTPDQVLAVLRDTATPFPVVGGRQNCTAVACGAGIVDAGAAVAQVAGAAAGTFSAVDPVRVLDSRIPARPLAAGTTRSVTLGGHSGVPLDASAVAVTFTAVGPGSGGYLTVFPTGKTRPGTSNLNFAAGSTTAGSAILPLGTNGQINVFNGSAGQINLVVDVTGYFRPGVATVAGAIRPVPATRILDTRTPAGGAGQLAGTSSRSVQVSGRAGIPSTATAVIATVSETGGRSPGYLSVFKTGASRPATSNVNFGAGATTAGLVVAQLNSTGQFSIYNGSPNGVSVVVDVTGYVIGGTATVVGSYVPVNPVRLLNTGSGATALAPGQTTAVRTAVPVTASGVVTTICAVAPTAAGSLTAFQTGRPAPATSNLNFRAGQTVADLAVTGGSALSVRNGGAGRTPLIVDLAGYFR